MDYPTGLVGIKRKVSWQSLCEELFIEPSQRLEESGSPAKERVRKAAKKLEAAGLLIIKSKGYRLIFDCVLADRDQSVQKNKDTIRTYFEDTFECEEIQANTTTYEQDQNYLDIPKNQNKDIHPVSGNKSDKSDLLDLCAKKQNFDMFWAMYPVRKVKKNAEKKFLALELTQELFDEMLKALDAQIKHKQQCDSQDIFCPEFPYAERWISQRRWEDEINEAMRSTRGNGNETDKQLRKRERDEVADEMERKAWLELKQHFKR